jgi:hypothetical protein
MDFYAPHPDVMTILCHDNNPVDVHLKGLGKLQVHSGCKGYSTSTLLYGSSVVGNTSVAAKDEHLFTQGVHLLVPGLYLWYS